MTLAVLKEPEPQTLTREAVPFLDLRVPEDERGELLVACEHVFNHGRLVNGPEVEQLEIAFAKACRRLYAVGVSSGTDALVLALRALGIGQGDEVIVPALSFVATANAVKIVGAEPIFCDIREDLNINPSEIVRHITPKTKAIMPVHWAGRMCAVDHIAMIAKTYNLKVIEDASQAFGATFNDDPPGFRADVACFSMNPMKTLAGLGEAGMIVTSDAKVYDRLQALRYQGVWNKEICRELSGNHRLDTIQAAMLLVRLKRFPTLLLRRRANAALYNEYLAGSVGIPHEAPHERLAWYTYTISSNYRDSLKLHLERRGIETKIQHPIVMPNQPFYKSTARGSWARAEALMKTTLCLPIHEKLTARQRDAVVDAVRSFC